MQKLDGGLLLVGGGTGHLADDGVKGDLALSAGSVKGALADILNFGSHGG